MAKYRVVDLFYKTPEWIRFREMYIAIRIKHDNGSRCDYCGGWIDKPSDITLHHIIELNPDNVRDALISLNPDNIKQVHRGCHNKIHKHASGDRPKRVFLVYGPPMSGKNTYVKQRSWPGDLIVDMDNIYQAISGLPRYDKPNSLYNNAITVQSALLDNIKTRYGRWDNAWIIGGYPEKYKRERIAKDVGAEIIFIKADELTCKGRLLTDKDRINRKKEWESYIDKWFNKYTV